MSKKKQNDGYIYMEVLFSILLILILSGALFLSVKPAAASVNKEKESVESFIDSTNSYYRAQGPLYE